MKRFGLKGLYLLIAALAAWSATFNLNGGNQGEVGEEIRTGVLFVIFISSAAAAICFHGRRRIFWSAFFVTMLLLALSDSQVRIYAPRTYLRVSGN